MLNSWPREAATIIFIKTAMFYKVEAPIDVEHLPSGPKELLQDFFFYHVSSHEDGFRTV